MTKDKKYKKLVLIGSLIGLLSTGCSNNYDTVEEAVSCEVDEEDNEVIDTIQHIELPTMEPSNMSSYATLINDADIYMGPSTEYNLVCNVKKDDRVNLVSKSMDNWYVVRYMDNYGFINSDNLNLENTIIPEDYVPFNTYCVVVAISDVNIRSNDDINSEILGTLACNEQVQLLADMENGWYKVIYNNEIAYVNKEYVYETINTKLANKYYKVICLKQDSNIQSLYNEVIELPKYECGKVFNETENYYLIETDNTIGYIAKENLLELNDRFVIVDISDQKLELYENNEVVFTSDVVTGRPHHETDMGIESVQFKQRNRTLRGRGYSSFVKYWMRINGNAEGLHDASWRSEFGGDIYETNGSHGCVNLPTDSAAYLYDELSVGDRVIVKR